MPRIELNDEDWNVIDSLLIRYNTMEREEAAEEVALHFIAAGLERAAKMCDATEVWADGPYSGVELRTLRDCAAAIRALK